MMALQVCKDCTCAYSVGAPKCPQCGSKKAVEQGSKGDPTLAGLATGGVLEAGALIRVGEGNGGGTDA